MLRSRTRRSSNRATTLVPLAAVSFGKTHTALGAFFRRLAARVGKANAVTATARKLAVFFYKMLRHGAAYQDPGADYYELRFRRRTLDNLRQRPGIQYGRVRCHAGGSFLGRKHSLAECRSSSRAKWWCRQSFERPHRLLLTEIGTSTLRRCKMNPTRSEPSVRRGASGGLSLRPLALQMTVIRSIDGVWTGVSLSVHRGSPTGGRSEPSLARP